MQTAADLWKPASYEPLRRALNLRKAPVESTMAFSRVSPQKDILARDGQILENVRCLTGNFFVPFDFASGNWEFLVECRGQFLDYDE